MPQQVSLFVGGLKNSIRIDDNGQKTQNLKAALCYDKLFELRYFEQKVLSNNVGSSSKKSGIDIVSTVNRSKEKSSPIVKKLSREEMMKRKFKRTTFNCDEQFSPGYL